MRLASVQVRCDRIRGRGAYARTAHIGQRHQKEGFGVLASLQ